MSCHTIDVGIFYTELHCKDTSDQDSSGKQPLLPQTSGPHHSFLHLNDTPDQDSGTQEMVLPQPSGIHHPDISGSTPDQDDVIQQLVCALPKTGRIQQSDLRLGESSDQDASDKWSLLPQIAEDAGDLEQNVTVTNALSLIASSYMD